MYTFLYILAVYGGHYFIWGFYFQFVETKVVLLYFTFISVYENYIYIEQIGNYFSDDKIFRWFP